MGNVTSEIPGIKFEQQEDGSVFAEKKRERQLRRQGRNGAFKDHRSACRSSVGYTVA